MCREKFVCVNYLKQRLGSPLRVQGKDEKKVEYTLAKRITPACAGKRILPPKLNTLPRNHPCVCREKEESGKEDQYRITPACAGKSYIEGGSRRPLQDHPCVCREKLVTFPFQQHAIGSPLRVQGKVWCLAAALPEYRITPACAGKRLG